VVIGGHHFQQLLLYQVSKVALLKTNFFMREPCHHPVCWSMGRQYSVGFKILVMVTMGCNPVQSGRSPLMFQRDVQLLSSGSKSKSIKSATSTLQALLDHTVLYPRW
jgi:hypothetical protein